MISLKEIKEFYEHGKNADSPEKSKIEISSKYKDIDAFKNWDEDSFGVFMLFYLYLMLENENEKLWESFKEEIQHKSRFFPKSELLEKIDNISEYASIELCKGTVLYRAREYKYSDYLNNKIMVAVYEKLKELLPNLRIQKEDFSSESALNIIMLALSGNVNKIEELQRCITEIIDEEKPFWGFDESNSDAPPKKSAIAGRANSCGISFLYATTDKKTAIMEMKPQIGQNFNICKIETCKDIRIFDFTYTSVELKEDEYLKSGDLYVISKEFSQPNFGNADDYVPTQYLCEYLREKGFDGIKYKSAVSPDGINLIIFDTNSEDKPYKIVESRVYAVSNINVEFEQILPALFEDAN